MTPPRLALAAAQVWDAAVDAVRLGIASDPALGRALLVGAALLDLSVRKARLPLKSGGLGHTSAVLLSPIAFYAAYSQHAFLDEGARTRLLEQELVSAAAVLRDVLLPVGLELVVPVADLGLVNPPRKLQRDLTRAAHALVFQRLMDLSHCVRDTRARAPHGCLPPFSRRSHVCCAVSRATSFHRGAAKLCCCCDSPLLRSWLTHQPRLTPRTSYDRG